MKTRRIKHYLRLNYPVRVVRRDGGFVADCPDLLGCGALHPELPAAYAAVEQARRQWITEAVLTDAEIPLPNSYLEQPRAPRPQHLGEEPTGSGAAPVAEPLG